MKSLRNYSQLSRNIFVSAFYKVLWIMGFVAGEGCYVLPCIVSLLLCMCVVVAFIFLPNKSARTGNVFMWVALFVGTGMLMCFYSMEWYARRRCPSNGVCASSGSSGKKSKVKLGYIIVCSKA